MIFNIQRHENFIETLLAWSQQNFQDEIFKLKIFFPNHRCCQKFQEAMIKNGYEGIAPQVKAIADLKIDDFYEFLPNQEVKNFIIEATKIRVLDDIESLFFVADELMRITIFGQLNFERAFKIAIDLKELLDDIETNDIELANLNQIDDSNLALHRQIGLEFLKDFYLEIKHSLLKQGLMLNSSFQNFLSKNFCQFVYELGLKQPTIIAGSTGSLAISRQIMKAILSQKNGHLVLFGLEPFQNQNKCESPAIKIKNHPQFLLHRLLEFLGCKPDEIQNLTTNKLVDEDDLKNRLISLLFVSSDDAILWQKAQQILRLEHRFSSSFSETEADNVKKNYDLRNCLELIVAKNELEESRLIINIIEDLLALNHKCSKISLNKNNSNLKIGIVCNSDLVKNLLRSGLDNSEITYNDSSTRNFFGDSLSNFLLLIFEIAHEEFNPHSLLALIKNRYFAIEQNQKIISDFEIAILRQELEKSSLTALLKRISKTSLREFLQKIIAALPTKKDVSSLIKSLEILSCRNFHEILENHPAKDEIAQFFKKLLTRNYQPSSTLELGFMFSQIAFFEKNLTSPKTPLIEILSPIEARLLKFDLLFVCGLTENNFPKTAREGWIGIKVRRDLGIEKAAIKIGQNSFDFCNFLSCKKVILSYGTHSKSLEQKPSPFILKLKTLCIKAGIDIDSTKIYQQKFRYFHSGSTKPTLKSDDGDNLTSQSHSKLEQNFALTRMGNLETARIANGSAIISAPNPKPLLQDRPTIYSITEISDLISNPYSLYVKKILQLKELKKIDYEPSNSEYGSFVHKSLEELVKQNSQIQTLSKATENIDSVDFEKIFGQFFISDEAKLIWLPKFKKILADFLVTNQLFLSKINQVEVPVSLNFATINRTILVRGRVDRIVINQDNSIEIFDYKTGNPPQNNEVANGKEPQLTIAAYILLHSLLPKSSVLSLNYWQLSRSDSSIIRNVFAKNNELQAAISKVPEGLGQVFSYFENENNGFFASYNPQKDRIQNLSRFKEWSR